MRACGGTGKSGLVYEPGSGATIDDILKSQWMQRWAFRIWQECKGASFANVPGK